MQRAIHLSNKRQKVVMPARVKVVNVVKGRDRSLSTESNPLMFTTYNVNVSNGLATSVIKCTTATMDAPCRLRNAMHEWERIARCSGGDGEDKFAERRLV